MEYDSKLLGDKLDFAEEKYEKFGQINNVVFPCGAVVRGDDVIIYYGGGDSVINVASLSLSELVKSLVG